MQMPRESVELRESSEDVCLRARDEVTAILIPFSFIPLQWDL